jgi:aspartyl-tRNA(Asn)/glutamyl-tRNA(Gln) amidotransferase subunit C
MNTEEIKHLAKLSSLEINAEQAQQISEELENILSLVAELQSVNTDDVEPLFHPIAMIQSLQQPLREDIIIESDNRTNNMLPAPVVHEGLYLVPKVIE